MKIQTIFAAVNVMEDKTRLFFALYVNGWTIGCCDKCVRFSDRFFFSSVEKGIESPRDWCLTALQMGA